MGGKLSRYFFFEYPVTTLKDDEHVEEILYSIIFTRLYITLRLVKQQVFQICFNFFFCYFLLNLINAKTFSLVYCPMPGTRDGRI